MPWPLAVSVMTETDFTFFVNRVLFGTVCSLCYARLYGRTHRPSPFSWISRRELRAAEADL